MTGWAEWLIPFAPFALTAVLLVIRLKAAGATSEEALKSVLTVLGLTAMMLLCFSVAAKGWRENKVDFLLVGLIACFAVFFALRFALRRVWERFPLKPDEAKGTDEGNN
ncbi:MAG: hypothetical protein ACUVTP_10030 [Candidatus Fervidibacter sp.]|uniref:hypothetical protein n=1 Tax=Candidatus Fervidibacter sp. TaxID=3100871 RepID=UPI00404A8A80